MLRYRYIMRWVCLELLRSLISAWVYSLNYAFKSLVYNKSILRPFSPPHNKQVLGFYYIGKIAANKRGGISCKNLLRQGRGKRFILSGLF